MKSMKRTGTMLVALALTLAACASEETTTTAGEDGSTTTVADGETSELSGQVVVSGSSTVEPISARVGEAFDEANPGVATSVEGPGTGDGFARFCADETDVSDASRPIKDEEAQTCADAGVEFVELKVAIDGLSVITAHENEAVSCLAFTDLYALLGPESEGFATWADANDLAAELGAPNAPYPDEPLVVTAPGEESGTFDSFIEIVLEDIADERGQDATTRADYTASANDNVIIQGISGNPTSLGWVGYAFYVENSDTVKALAVDDGESGCVEPTPETISSGEYPIARDLYVYVKTNELADRPELAAWVDYYLSDEGMANVADAGYVDLAPEALEETRTAWEDAKTTAGV